MNDSVQVALNFKIDVGEVLKQRGMYKALDYAEEVVNNFKEQALFFIMNYPKQVFKAEDVRDFAYSHKMPRPPTERAWGSVMNEAKKMGIIKHIGYKKVDNPRAHKTPASLWEKC